MRIAFLTNRFSPPGAARGGQAAYLERVAAGLARLGHDIEVFFPGKTPVASTDNNGVTLHPIPVDENRIRFWRRLTRWRFPIAAHALCQAAALGREFRKRHDEKPFEIVQTANLMACALFVAGRVSVPVTARLSNHPELMRAAYDHPATLDQRLCAWLERRALSRCTGLYAPSRFLAEKYRELDGLSVEVLPPPFALPENDGEENPAPEPARREGYLLYFGELTRLKGLDLLADALPALMAEFPKLHFVAAGDEIEDRRKYLAPLQERLAAFPGRFVRFAALPPERLYPLVRGARLVALPSRVENLPNAMLEAMALARPVVGARGASFEEMLSDGENGFLFASGDAAALAAKLREAWALPEARLAEIGTAAQAAVKKLAPEQTLPPLVAHYERVAAAFRAAG